MRPNQRLVLTCVGAIALAAALAAAGGDGTDDGAELPHGVVVETDTHRFEEVAPGVHFIVGTGTIFVQSNAMLVLSDEDALVVDSHVTPAAARALLASIAEVTDKPVTHLVNTHYHFDHAHGNQVFPEDVAIIGHEFTREMLMSDVLEQGTYLNFSGAIPDQIAAMKEEAGEMEDGEAKEALMDQIAVQEAHNVALAETEPTPPNVTLTDRMTIHRTWQGQDRPIELIHLGRGHTGGDVVVLLPNERIVFTGDLVLPGGSAYIGDGYIDEWLDTLDRFEELEFDLVLPGHGETFSDVSTQLGLLRDMLSSFWNDAVSARDQGLSAEEAISTIEWQGFLATAPDPIRIQCVERAWAVMDETGSGEDTESE